MNQIQIITTEEVIEEVISKAIDKILGEREQKELPKYFTVPQLAKFTGYSVATINIKNSKKKIPGSRKVNGRVLFDSATIIDWIESGAIKTKKERLQVLESNFKNRRVKK